MTLEIRPVNWREAGPILSELRRHVFIEEQRVPEELEWDGADEAAQHWLALREGEPIGTARLLRNGHIGRMAVLAHGRGRGIGSALLQAAVAAARAAQQREVYLHAQTHALPFYQRAGFTAEGPEFIDAGIPHRTMRLVLREQRVLGTDSGRFAVHDRAAVALDLAQQASRRLRLLSNTLDHTLFDNPEFAAALSQLARRGRSSELRLLVVETQPLVQRGHRVLELARRLSTTLQLRRADCRPEDIRDNFLVADERGVLCYALKEPEKAWADYNSQPLAVDYAAQFDELWHRSIDDPALRLLQL